MSVENAQSSKVRRKVKAATAGGVSGAGIAELAVYLAGAHLGVDLEPFTDAVTQMVLAGAGALGLGWLVHDDEETR